MTPFTRAPKSAVYVLNLLAHQGFLSKQPDLKASISAPLHAMIAKLQLPAPGQGGPSLDIIDMLEMLPQCSGEPGRTFRTSLLSPLTLAMVQTSFAASHCVTPHSSQIVERCSLNQEA